MVNFSLEGKIALVTGASYGIGFGIASAYAEAGATICFNDLSQEKVDKGIAAYKEIGVDAHGYVCDVTDEAQVQEMVAKIKEEVGIIDILVNNAGIIMRKPMLEMEADTHLISLLLQRHRQPAGEHRKTFRERQYSLHLTHQTS